MATSSADCKALLTGYASSLITRTLTATGLSVGSWKRMRKYKTASGEVARDFFNAGIPVVLTVVETPSGLVVTDERALCGWEAPFETHFSAFRDGETGLDPYIWEEEVMWTSLRPAHFAFGVGHDEDDGDYYFFQPSAAAAGIHSEHTPVDAIAARAGVTLPPGGEVCESTWTFEADTDTVRASLIAAGFIHDPALDARSGS